MDSAVRNVYDKIMNGIRVWIQVCVYDPNTWRNTDFWYKLPCGRCAGKIPRCQMPVNVLSHQRAYPYTSVKWSRIYVCTGCVTPISLRKPLDTSWRKKSHRSAQVLLLLLEVGLPYDLAWPVAAAAYWLL